MPISTKFLNVLGHIAQNYAYSFPHKITSTTKYTIPINFSLYKVQLKYMLVDIFSCIVDIVYIVDMGNLSCLCVCVCVFRFYLFI